MNDINILVVDDEDVVLESCERALTTHKYRVYKACCVDDALAMMEKAYFDLVIIDLIMPKRGGMDLLKIIKQKYQNVLVIMITGYSSINTAVESIKLGAADYLPKPFTPYELVLTVRNALESKGRTPHPFVSYNEPTEMIFDNIIGRSPRIFELFHLIGKIASTDTTVLINGESGTGKELAAKAIHRNSNRRDNNFVVVDCLSLSPTLLESELFGHTKGSFTGATSNKVGFFEVANKGTIFLDEIGDLSFELQGKLLRVLQEHKYIPVGGTVAKETDIRVIAATNKDLKKMVQTGAFREDLFYRLYVVPIFMPPLRERKEDIALLIEFFINRNRDKYNRPVVRMSADAMAIITAYHWPGNVRELENTIERAFINCDGKEILPNDLPSSIRDAYEISGIKTPRNIEELKNETKRIRQKAVEDVEKKFIIEALSTNCWRVSQAADAVGMQRTNFYRLMKKYGITSPRGDEEFDRAEEADKKEPA